MRKNLFSNFLIPILRKTRIKKRLTWVFLVTSLLSVLAVSFFSTLATYYSMEKKAVDYSVNITSQLVNSLSVYLNDFVERFERVSGDIRTLTDLMEYDFANFAQREQIENRMRLTFGSIFGSNKNIDTVEASTPRNTRFYFNTPITSGNVDSQIIRQTNEAPSKSILWLTSPKETKLDSKTYVILSKKLFYKEGYYGNLFLSIKRDYLDEVCKSNTVTNSSNIIIADRQGLIISHPDSSPAGAQIDNEIMSNINRIERSNNKTRYFRLSNQLIAYGVLPGTEWLVLNVMSFPSLMESTMNNIVVISVVCLVLILLSLALSMIVTKSISKPVSELVNAMRDDAKSVTGDVMTADDEYSKLAIGFNKMTKRLSALIEDNYRSELKNKQLEIYKNEAELSLLQQQINPHFLYNTLEVIYWSGQIQGNEEISEMVTALGNYFRSIINKGREYITVEREIDNVSNYLLLQNKRFSDRISIIWNVEPTCFSLFIIKPTFQPIIEDIITFSAEKTDSLIKIEIDIFLDDCLTVKMSGENIQTLPTDKTAVFPGIDNVKQRLQLYFGDKFGIQGIQSKDQTKGCTYKHILIKMPVFDNPPDVNYFQTSG